jgi:hypothetical protein
MVGRPRETYPAVVFRGPDRPPDITDTATPAAAASGCLAPSVYSPRDVMQPEIHAHVGC